MAITTDTPLFGKFAIEGIFDDAKINTFFNQLYQLLIQGFSLAEVEAGLLIDGGVALELQAEDPGSINHIAMTFTSEKLFRFLKASIRSLPVTSSEASGDFLIVKVAGVVIRFGLVLGTVSIVTVKGLKLRNKTQIHL